MTHPTFVYALHGADNCLYVGCTGLIGKRLAAHQRKPWWLQVVSVNVETYPDEASGYAAERELIKKLNPTYNTVFTDHDGRGGGWATRRINAKARHDRGETCRPWFQCAECNRRRHEAARSFGESQAPDEAA